MAPLVLDFAALGGLVSVIKVFLLSKLSESNCMAALDVGSSGVSQLRYIFG